MSQMPLFTTPLWNVTELTRYLRDLLQSDPILQDIWVQGEISNFSRPASGHLYFTLKDSASALKCVMWRNAASRLSFNPRDGLAVEVHGGMSIYEAAGQYQLYADTIRPAGEGALYQEFLRLKARLEIEGLLDPERKRPIPRRPKLIGIVTSPTGAALRDMLNTLRRRYPLAKVVLSPSQVQGADAPASLVAALDALNKIVQPDVILLARGGGSIEDLWAFNDENLARAIAASPTPVICGVGHETDFTIADFVADLRAPTPTAAAELATPNLTDLQTGLVELHTRLNREISSQVATRQWDFERLQNRLRLRSPAGRIANNRQQVDELLRRLGSAFEKNLHVRETRRYGLEQSLLALNPLAVLRRGYALVFHQEGGLIRSITQIHSNDWIKIRLHDGEISAEAGASTRYPDQLRT